MRNTTFLLKSTIHKAPHWFAGAVEGRVTGGLMIVLTPTIFDAVFFEASAEAQELLDDGSLDASEWVITEATGPIPSAALQHEAPKP